MSERSLEKPCSRFETHLCTFHYQTPKLDAESGSSLQTKTDASASATFGFEVLKLNPRTLHPGIRNLRMLEVVFRFFLMWLFLMSVWCIKHLINNKSVELAPKMNLSLIRFYLISECPGAGETSATSRCTSLISECKITAISSNSFVIFRQSYVKNRQEAFFCM
jgi:hypothetical protein